VYKKYFSYCLPHKTSIIKADIHTPSCNGIVYPIAKFAHLWKMLVIVNSFKKLIYYTLEFFITLATTNNTETAPPGHTATLLCLQCKMHISYWQSWLNEMYRITQICAYILFSAHATSRCNHSKCRRSTSNYATNNQNLCWRTRNHTQDDSHTTHTH